MSRPRFDVAGLWQHDPAPQNGDQGHGPNRPTGAVQAAPPPWPTLAGSQEQAAVQPPVPLPARPQHPAQPAGNPSNSTGQTASRRTTVYAATPPDAWLREAARFASPVWVHQAVSRWPRPVTCLSVSTTGPHASPSPGWSVGFGLVSLMFPFVAWAGGGWSGRVRSVPFMGGASWTVGAAPLWPNRYGDW